MLLIPENVGLPQFTLLNNLKANLLTCFIRSLCRSSSDPDSDLWGALSSWGLQPPPHTLQAALPGHGLLNRRTRQDPPTGARLGALPHTWPPGGALTLPPGPVHKSLPCRWGDSSPSLSFPFCEMGTMTPVRGVNRLKCGEEAPCGGADTQRAPARPQPAVQHPLSRAAPDPWGAGRRPSASAPVSGGVSLGPPHLRLFQT